MSMPSLDDETLDDLYSWLNKITLSRQIKQFPKDFADGVLVAEVVAHFLPRYVDLKNFMPAHSAQLKKYNWETLNKTVFTYLDFAVPPGLMDKLVNCVPGAAEHLLYALRIKLELAVSERRFHPRRGRHRSASSNPRCNGSNLSLAGSETSDEECVRNGLGTPGRSRPSRLSGIKRSTPTAKRAPSLTKFNIGIMCEPNGSGAAADSDAGVAAAHGSGGTFVDMVPARALYRAQLDAADKEEKIHSLAGRVRHLEKSVALKDERIAQLTERLDRLARAYYEKHAPPPQEPNAPTDEQRAAAATVLLQQLKSLHATLSPAHSSATELCDAASTPSVGNSNMAPSPST